MKARLFFFMLAAFTLVSSVGAQGTLQFNQALLINAGSGVLTVPTGKVWKIVAGASQAQSLSSNRPFTINLNGITNHFVFRSQDGNSNPITTTMNPFPYWVPAGTTVELPAISAGGFRSLSVIEFNIIP